MSLEKLKQTKAPEFPDVAAMVRMILSIPDAELSYVGTKVVLDSLVDPTLDAKATMAELDDMASRVSAMAGPNAVESARLGAIRHLIYESGPWNGYRPFAYDHSDPSGKAIPAKLIANYLATRRGNCVSMPILFLILAERLGIDMRLASAPHHIFLRYASPDGQVFSIEATSGGHPARDDWYRRNFRMSDRAIESGLYMRTLSRRESVALMATTVLEHLIAQDRHREAIEVAGTILEHSPRDGQVMVAQASSYGWLIQTEFAAKYPYPLLIPEPACSRYRTLCQRNEMLFAKAEALGWEPGSS